MSHYAFIVNAESARLSPGREFKTSALMSGPTNSRIRLHADPEIQDRPDGRLVENFRISKKMRPFVGRISRSPLATSRKGRIVFVRDARDQSFDAALPFYEGMIGERPQSFALCGEHRDAYQLAVRFHDPGFQERPHRGLTIWTFG
jgi:hypothetical protein